MSKLSKLKRWALIISLSSLGTAFIADRNIKIEDDSLPPISNPSQDWQLAKLPKSPDFEQIYTQLQKKQAWGKAQATKKTDDKDKKADKKKIESKRDWKLLGLLQQAQQRYMLIQTKDNKVKRYQAGDSLPSGKIILNLSTDTVILKTPDDSAIETVYLYPKSKP